MNCVFGQFIGSYESPDDPAIQDCTFRDMPNLRGITVNNNSKYYSDENGVLLESYETLFDVTVGDERVLSGVYARLIKAPSDITSYEVPDHVRIVERYAFSRTPLTSIDLNNVQIVGSHAFYSCTELGITK